MSVTVADCLKLPALKEASVVAGKNNLNMIITAVSVLEYAEVSVLADFLFIGNELVITAFISAMNDVEKQCLVIRRLREVGVVALVLYYVGIFVPRVDERLIETADQIGLPLICMPMDRFDFRYGEVISEVMEAVFHDQSAESHFVASILDRISQLTEQQRNISTVLRMLSDRLRCSIMLAGKNKELKGNAAYPMSAQWNYPEVLERYFRQAPQGTVDDPFKTHLNGSDVWITHAIVSPDHLPDMYLFAIDTTGKITPPHIAQAAELIQLFINIWKYDFEQSGADALVKAILNDDPARMRMLARQLNIDVDSIHTMWILKESSQHGTRALKSANTRRAVIAKLFLQEQRKLALVDNYDDCVVMFMDDPPYAELNAGMAQQFLQALNEPSSYLVLANFPGLLTTRDVRESYVLFQECWNAALAIYPTNRMFTRHELSFVKNCMHIFELGEQAAMQHISVLNPLKSTDDYEDLVNTLGVYLLDANGNMQDTGERMFLHKNTVKYRINKIKQRLDYDITKMPEAYALYQAAALYRLLK